MTENTQTTEQMQMPHCLRMTELDHSKNIIVFRRFLRHDKEMQTLENRITFASIQCRLLIGHADGYHDLLRGQQEDGWVTPPPPPQDFLHVRPHYDECEKSTKEAMQLGCTRGSLHGDQCPSQWEMEQRFRYEHISGREQIA